MKKFLLLFVAAVMAVSTSAQPFQKKDAGKPVSKTSINVAQSFNSFKVAGFKNAAFASQDRNYGQSLRSVKAMPMTAGVAQLQVPVAGLKRLPAEVRSAAAPKKAADASMLKEAYKGTCGKLNSATKAWDPVAAWDVTPGTVTYSSGTYPCIYDIFPANDLFKESIEFEYYIEGDQVIMPATPMADYDDTHCVFYVDYSSFVSGGDGAIVLNLAADGTLTVPEDCKNHVYGWFVMGFDEKYNPTSDILGAYRQYAMFEYTAAGDVEPENFVSEVKYTGKGFDKGDAVNVEWVMEIGKDTLGNDVIRNIIPTIDQDGAAMDVPVTVAGNTIKVAPYKVGETSKYFLYLESATTADGAITITKDPETGYLTLPEGEGIMVGAYTSDEYNQDYYAGYWSWIEKVKYFAEGQPIPDPAPTVYAEALQDGMLWANLSLSGYGYNSCLGVVPPYAAVTFHNYTKDEATGFQWTGSTSVEEGETPKDLSTTNTDLVIATDPDDAYTGISLVGYNKENASDPYNVGWNGKKEAAYIYAGFTGSQFEFTDGTLATMTMNNPDNDLKFYTNWGTPDIYSTSMSKIYIYGAKPVAPLYIEGITLPLVSFAQNSEDFALTCKICKATRSASGKLTVGDVIAQCDATAENINDEYKESSGLASIEFDAFYVEDEDGMTEDVDYLFLDEEFCLVIEGWDNGTFSGVMGAEDLCSELAPKCVWFEKTGEEGSMYSYSSWLPKLLVGYTGAAYGYLQTSDSTVVALPAEGGSASITIRPYLCSVNEEGAQTTRLYVEGEVPEWLTVDVANEDYSDEYKFDLVLTAEAAAEDRAGSFRVFQEGAYLDITVSQSKSTGISTVVKPAKGGKTYNLAGQRVDKAQKGVYVVGGQKVLVK